MATSTPKFTIRLEGENLTFSAVHFITFRDGGKESDPIVEPPHSHLFRVKAAIAGPLGDDSLLIDFQTARDILLEILRKFHGKTILADRQAGMTYDKKADSLRVWFTPIGEDNPRILTFGKDETVTLRADNSSTEAIALFIAETFRNRLAERDLFPAGIASYSVLISLEEEPGMIAEVRLEG